MEGWGERKKEEGEKGGAVSGGTDSPLRSQGIHWTEKERRFIGRREML